MKDQTCAGYRSGGMTCTAGEFTVSPVFSAAPGTPPFCIAGNSFSFKVDLGLSGTNANRYDVGFFVGQQGNDPTATTGGNICSVAAFPTTPSPWLNLNGNACGDYLAGANFTTTIDEIKVVCTGDSAGALRVPYVVTYWQNSGGTCNGPGDVSNGAPSKCNKGTSSVSGTVSVYSGAYVDVTKQTLPDGDSQSFSFTATGPVGSKVIALTGSTTLGLPQPTDGAYTPATIAAATNTTTVTLTDGQTARFYINALPANQTLTITEAATTDWESAAAITCNTVTGSPALTTDNANRTISAVLNTTNSSAACTITNTERSRITLAKNVAGRADAADQFTVSASGGGTLTGTTSATTAGAGTSASTTFRSTPNAALTVTDAKASGPTALAGYETTLTCTNAFTGSGATPDASLPNNLSTASASITPAPGDDITCTFTNTPKPDLTVVKSVQAYSDPVNGTSSPKAIPGSFMFYTVLVTNSGLGAVDNNTTVITDPVPVNTELYVGDISGAGSGPVRFTDGATPSGLCFDYADPGACAGDGLLFSHDNGASYVAAFTPDANGCDATITHVKILLGGIFSASDGTNNPSFDVKFRVRVK